jgi:hypothetical protein
VGQLLVTTKNNLVADLIDLNNSKFSVPQKLATVYITPKGGILMWILMPFPYFNKNATCSKMEILVLLCART